MSLQNYPPSTSAYDVDLYYGTGTLSCEEETIDFCIFCERPIMAGEFACSEPVGWIHRTCKQHREEEARGMRIIEALLYVAFAIVAVYLFVHYGLKWSSK